MNYFEQLTTLLKEEQHYDRTEHENLLFKSTLQERRTQGVTWFPIAITNSELGRGDYLSITLNKTNNLEEGHRFRFGMPVSLFSNHDPETDRVNGMIAFVNRDTMRISFRIDELPDWSRRGKLGVDLLFDENSYREMHHALEEAGGLADDSKQGSLVRQLIGQDDIIQQHTRHDYQHTTLNSSQNSAISHILQESPLSILHGPPGTGKTTTLVRAIEAILKQRPQQILLVAPSNTAVDVLTERLDAIGVSVVRIGNSVKVSAHLQELTLDAKVEKHPANKEIKNLEKQARAYTDMAHKYKRNFGKSERDQRKALFDEARKIRKEIDKIQDYIIQDIFDKVEVITATLVGSNHYSIRDRRYNTVIIDEAAQALEPACWIPILKAENIILAGDHQQLPPTVKSSQQSTSGLYHTLFEKLVSRYPDQVSLLDVQYRMNTQIMQYSSRLLYEDRLKAAAQVADWTLKDDDDPIIFIDTAGAGYEETIVDATICNKEEAYFLKKHLQSQIEQWTKLYKQSEWPSIGIIVPYRAQSLFLREIITQDENFHPFLGSIQINTIDSFQGQEKDVIYISLTRSNSVQQIGFLSDVRRMNVAMTRAKKKLIVIGDSGTIGKHPFYKGFLDHIESLNTYHSVWEWDIGG